MLPKPLHRIADKLGSVRAVSILVTVVSVNIVMGVVVIWYPLNPHATALVQLVSNILSFAFGNYVARADRKPSEQSDGTVTVLPPTK